MGDYADELSRAAQRYRKAQAAMDESRDELARIVRRASLGGTRQVDILRAIDHVWTREYVRQVLQRQD